MLINLNLFNIEIKKLLSAYDYIINYFFNNKIILFRYLKLIDCEKLYILQVQKDLY